MKNFMRTVIRVAVWVVIIQLVAASVVGIVGGVIMGSIGLYAASFIALVLSLAVGEFAMKEAVYQGDRAFTRERWKEIFTR